MLKASSTFLIGTEATEYGALERMEEHEILNARHALNGMTRDFIESLPGQTRTPKWNGCHPSQPLPQASP
eukprot:456418-Prorocentrum_lima.AAC.1